MSHNGDNKIKLKTGASADMSVKQLSRRKPKDSKSFLKIDEEGNERKVKPFLKIISETEEPETFSVPRSKFESPSHRLLLFRSM